jgi:hypothetical protein
VPVFTLSSGSARAALTLRTLGISNVPRDEAVFVTNVDNRHIQAAASRAVEVEH